MKDKYILQIAKKGNKKYFKNRSKHREDGPATINICKTNHELRAYCYFNPDFRYIYTDNDEIIYITYYLHGERLSKRKFEMRTNK